MHLSLAVLPLFFHRASISFPLFSSLPSPSPIRQFFDRGSGQILQGVTNGANAAANDANAAADETVRDGEHQLPTQSLAEEEIRADQTE